METLSRSRSHRRLYSGGINNTTSQIRGTLMGKAGHGSNHSTTASITEELHPALIHNYKKAGQNLTDVAAQAEWANKRWVWVTDAALGYIAGWIISEAEDMAQVACVDDKVCIIQLNSPLCRITEHSHPCRCHVGDLQPCHSGWAEYSHRPALYHSTTSPR